jgi:ribonuclease D
MIHLIGVAPVSDKYVTGTWEEFKQWSIPLKEFELDVETDVTPYWCTRKLITVQVGYKSTAWVLQWSELDDWQRDWIKLYLEDNTRIKLIHHAQFEYITLRFHGIEIGNVYDTMVVEKVLTGGLENANYSLSDLHKKYLGSELDKTEQTTFGDNILTENKVVYAAKDVQILDPIRALQIPQIVQWGLINLVNLENKVVLALGEMTYHGTELDKVKWKENEDWARPFVDSSLKNLNKWLIEDPKLNAKAKELGFLSDKDTMLWNLNAPQQKKELLNLLYPDLEGATKAIIVKYLRDKGVEMPVNDIILLQDVINKDYYRMHERLVTEHRGYLITRGFLVPAGEIQINWNSTTQALVLLQAVHPKLKDLSEESVAKTTHPVFKDLEDYKDNLKLINSFGQAFVDKYVEPDGMVRTEYNQVVSTGRLSSKRPKLCWAA